MMFDSWCRLECLGRAVMPLVYSCYKSGEVRNTSLRLALYAGRPPVYTVAVAGRDGSRPRGMFHT